MRRLTLIGADSRRTPAPAPTRHLDLVHARLPAEPRSGLADLAAGDARKLHIQLQQALGALLHQRALDLVGAHTQSFLRLSRSSASLSAVTAKVQLCTRAR